MEGANVISLLKIKLINNHFILLKILYMVNDFMEKNNIANSIST